MVDSWRWVEAHKATSFCGTERVARHCATQTAGHILIEREIEFSVNFGAWSRAHPAKDGSWVQPLQPVDPCVAG